VIAQFGRFVGDSLKDVINKGVHDAHSLAGDTSIWMNLLQDFVDVNGISLLPSLSALFLVTRTFGDCLLGSLGWSFNYVLCCHC